MAKPTVTVAGETVTVRRGATTVEMTTDEFAALAVEVGRQVERPDPPDPAQDPEVVPIEVAGQIIPLSVADAEALHRQIGRDIREQKSKRRPTDEEREERKREVLERMREEAIGRGVHPDDVDDLLGSLPEKMPAQAVERRVRMLLERGGLRPRDREEPQAGTTTTPEPNRGGGGRGRA